MPEKFHPKHAKTEKFFHFCLFCINNLNSLQKLNIFGENCVNWVGSDMSREYIFCYISSREWNKGAYW